MVSRQLVSMTRMKRTRRKRMKMIEKAKVELAPRMARK